MSERFMLGTPDREAFLINSGLLSSSVGPITTDNSVDYSLADSRRQTPHKTTALAPSKVPSSLPPFLPSGLTLGSLALPKSAEAVGVELVRHVEEAERRATVATEACNKRVADARARERQCISVLTELEEQIQAAEVKLWSTLDAKQMCEANNDDTHERASSAAALEKQNAALQREIARQQAQLASLQEACAARNRDLQVSEQRQRQLEEAWVRKLADMQREVSELQSQKSVLLEEMAVAHPLDSVSCNGAREDHANAQARETEALYAGALVRLEEMERELSSVSSTYQGSIRRMQRESSALSREIAQLASTKKLLVEQVEILNGTVSETQKSAADLRATCEEKQRQADTLGTTVKELRRDEEAAQERLSLIRSQTAREKQKLNELQDELCALQSETEKKILSAARETQDLVWRLSSESAELEASVRDRRNDVASLESRIRRLKDEEKALKKETAQLAAENDELERTMEAKKKDVLVLTASCAQKKKQLTAFQEEQEKLSAAAHREGERLNTLSDSMQQRLRSLANESTRLEAVIESQRSAIKSEEEKMRAVRAEQQQTVSWETVQAAETKARAEVEAAQLSEHVALLHQRLGHVRNACSHLTKVQEESAARRQVECAEAEDRVALMNAIVAAALCQHQRSCDELQLRQTEADERLHERNVQLHEMEKDSAALQETINARTEAVEALQQRLVDLQSASSQAKGRLLLLHSSVENTDEVMKISSAAAAAASQTRALILLEADARADIQLNETWARLALATGLSSAAFSDAETRLTRADRIGAESEVRLRSRVAALERESAMLADLISARKESLASIQTSIHYSQAESERAAAGRSAAQEALKTAEAELASVRAAALFDRLESTLVCSESVARGTVCLEQATERSAIIHQLSAGALTLMQSQCSAAEDRLAECEGCQRRCEDRLRELEKESAALVTTVAARKETLAALVSGIESLQTQEERSAARLRSVTTFIAEGEAQLESVLDGAAHSAEVCRVVSDETAARTDTVLYAEARERALLLSSLSDVMRSDAQEACKAAQLLQRQIQQDVDERKRERQRLEEESQRLSEQIAALRAQNDKLESSAQASERALQEKLRCVEEKTAAVAQCEARLEEKLQEAKEKEAKMDSFIENLDAQMRETEALAAAGTLDELRH